MEQSVPPTITVRPSKELRPLLLRLAKDLDKSEGQILLESAAAILAMLETGEDHVPAMVRAIREGAARAQRHLLGADANDWPPAFARQARGQPVLGD